MSENKPEPKKEKVRIFMLGGLDEDGKNMMCVEVDGKIFIIEAGLKFPDAKESLGIEYIIQDFSYLIEHKNDIAGIIITLVTMMSWGRCRICSNRSKRTFTHPLWRQKKSREC